MIKYRFGLNSLGVIIDIKDLTKETLNNQKFYSIDFQQELIPKLGKIKVKHFALKPNSTSLGSKETYLHALGKKVFYEEYVKSLNSKKPFYIRYESKPRCNRLEAEFGIKCILEKKYEKFDLTTYFDQIIEEKKDGQFIPDLCLRSSSKEDKIYIEIAVTHYLSESKKYSGTRIIEIAINNEENIGEILKLKNGESTVGISYYNFKTKKAVIEPCKIGNCMTEFYLFITNINGTSVLMTVKERFLRENLKNRPDHVIHTIVQPMRHNDKPYGDMYRYFLSKAHSEGVKINNCFICKYHAINNSWDYTDREPIFCKYLKKKCSSNFAANCETYRPSNEYVKTYLNG